MSWHTLLVLGGIGSGKSAYAQSLLAGENEVRRVAAATGAGLTELARTLAAGTPGEVLLVEGLGQWLPTGGGSDQPDPGIEALAAATAASPARLVLVSAEVGLCPAPATAADRQFAESLGALNQALAAAADAVVLVVAGQPSWLKGGDRGAAAIPGPVAATSAAIAPPATAPDLASLSRLPVPDEAAKSAAADRLAGLGAVGLGALAEVVRFAAGTQGSPTPAPWQRIRTLVLAGTHQGGASAGATGAADRATALRDGSDPLALLAGPAGASLQIVAAATAAPIEDGPAMTEDEVEAALGYGWQLAEQAADEGVDVIVLASIGDGAEAAAAAVASALAPSTEPAGLLARVRTSQGTIDDPAWMTRCAAVRDAVHRTRTAVRTGGRPVLAELGGADLAIATGVLLGAAARRTPVLLDGPVGAAAALAARNLATASRHWWLLPDTSGHPLVTRVAETLGLTPLLDLRLELGEGASSLAALPLLQTGLSLAGTLPPQRSGPTITSDASAAVADEDAAEA